MKDISSTFAEMAKRQAELTADGGRSANIGQLTRAAAEAMRQLSIRTGTEVKQVATNDAQVTGALKALAAASAAAEAAKTQGAQPPLKDDEAKALKRATADANGISESDLDAKGVKSVRDLDDAIGTLGSAEATALRTARTDLKAKQQALAEKRDAALAELAAVLGRAASISGWVNGAKARFGLAQQLIAAADMESHQAAVVAYADYAAAKDVVDKEMAADPNGTVAQGKWTAAADAWLTALADAAAAEVAVIEKQLALDGQLAAKAAAQQTRDTDAADRVATTLGS